MAKFINKLKLYCLDKGKTEEEFNIKVQCQNDKDGKGDWISYWDLDIDKPTDEQLATYESSAQTKENNEKIDFKRRTEYLSWQEQFEMIYKDQKNGTSTYKDHCDKVRSDNPKE